MASSTRRANRLAHHLRGLGVGPEVLVGLCLERSLEMMVGLLAILKAGGAYLPLDPAYPKERLGFMIEDAGRGPAPEPGKPARVPAGDGGENPLPRSRRGLWAQSPTDDPPSRSAAPANLAYVIYTSGSTGRPKGVHGHAWQCDASFRGDGSGFGFGPDGCLDAVPFLRLRLLGVGDVGRAALRRPAGGRALLGEPVAGGAFTICSPRRG